MSEFFNEDVTRIDPASLTPEQMRKAQKVMMSFPKEQLTPADSEPILKAGRKIMFGSTLVTVGTFLFTRRIPNIPKQVPTLAAISACIVAGRMIADSQRLAMWEGILSGKTQRSLAIIRALQTKDDVSSSVETSVVPERQVRLVFPPNPYNGSSTRDQSDYSIPKKTFRTWDDIRQEASSHEATSFVDEKEILKND